MSKEIAPKATKKIEGSNAIIFQFNAHNVFEPEDFNNELNNKLADSPFIISIAFLECLITFSGYTSNQKSLEFSFFVCAHNYKVDVVIFCKIDNLICRISFQNYRLATSIFAAFPTFST